MSAPRRFRAGAADGAARGRADAFNADAAGSDVEDAEAAVKRTRRG